MNEIEILHKIQEENKGNKIVNEKILECQIKFQKEIKVLVAVMTGCEVLRAVFIH